MPGVIPRPRPDRAAFLLTDPRSSRFRIARIGPRPVAGRPIRQLETHCRTPYIVADGYDLAVRMSALEDSSLIARKIAPRRIMVAASPGYLIRHGRPMEPEELRSHSCLTFPEMWTRIKLSTTVWSQSRDLWVGILMQTNRRSTINGQVFIVDH